MNTPPAMNEWPEFVTNVEETTRRGVAAGQLTGWETVIFEVADDQEVGLSSECSTAALAP